MNIKEEYKIKYQELTLTGDIAKCPRFIYEYYLPDDFEEVIEIYQGEEEEPAEGCKVYLNNSKLVLAANVTPLVLGYKPEGV